jgi:hypothetical protein
MVSTTKALRRLWECRTYRLVETGATLKESLTRRNIADGGGYRMNRKLNISLALAAGLVGGAISRSTTPVPVLAQSQFQKEIKAQSFVLVDEKDNIIGTFKPSADRTPTVVLLDRNGREIWRAGVSAKVLSER